MLLLNVLNEKHPPAGFISKQVLTNAEISAQEATLTRAIKTISQAPSHSLTGAHRGRHENGRALTEEPLFYWIYLPSVSSLPSPIGYLFAGLSLHRVLLL